MQIFLSIKVFRKCTFIMKSPFKFNLLAAILNRLEKKTHSNKIVCLRGSYSIFSDEN